MLHNAVELRGHREVDQIFKFNAAGAAGDFDVGGGESAGINRLGIENERVLQRKVSQLLWP
ncbi:MAG: hypothetical protein ACI9VS_001069 [Candidatus Binatia bacterium]